MEISAELMPHVTLAESFELSLVGHCHPRVTQTAQLQMARFGTGIPSYLINEAGGSENSSRYVERLTKTLPNQLNTVLFFTSG